MGIARVMHLVAFEAAFHLFLAECKRQGNRHHRTLLSAGRMNGIL